MANPEHVELFLNPPEGSLNLDLKNLDLSNADLHNSLCNNGRFVDVNFFGTNLESSFLLGARFERVDFRKARLKFCVMGGTIFADCDLDGALDLDSINHLGPSSLGIDTILRSKGNIPYNFLRRCGMPDHAIKFVESMAQTPIQLYSCFISHSAKDEPFPSHLFEKLQNSDVRCYYFPRTARTGEKLWEEIDRAIHLHDKEVIICSVNSLSSESVIREIEKGLKREKEEAVRKLKDADLVADAKMAVEDFASRRYHTRVLFPITIDDYLFEHWKHPLKTEICNRVVADFRGWDDPKIFKTQFEKLLNDLNAQDLT